MATRQFRRAAELLLDAIATFTRCELIDLAVCVCACVPMRRLGRECMGSACWAPPPPLRRPHVL